MNKTRRCRRLQHGGGPQLQKLIHYAIINGDTEKARDLIGPALLDHRNDDEDTFLTTAIRSLNPRMVRYLVDRGSDLNVQTRDGLTPLMIIYSPHEPYTAEQFPAFRQILRTLLAAHERINPLVTDDSGRNVLMVALDAIKDDRIPPKSVEPLFRLFPALADPKLRDLRGRNLFDYFYEHENPVVAALLAEHLPRNYRSSPVPLPIASVRPRFGVELEICVSVPNTKSLQSLVALIPADADDYQREKLAWVLYMKQFAQSFLVRMLERYPAVSAQYDYILFSHSPKDPHFTHVFDLRDRVFKEVRDTHIHKRIRRNTNQFPIDPFATPPASRSRASSLSSNNTESNTSSPPPTMVEVGVNEYGIPIVEMDATLRYDFPLITRDVTIRCPPTANTEAVPNSLLTSFEFVSPILSDIADLAALLQFIGLADFPQRFHVNDSVGYHVNISLTDTTTNTPVRISRSMFEKVLLPAYLKWEAATYPAVRPVTGPYGESEWAQRLHTRVRNTAAAANNSPNAPNRFSPTHNVFQTIRTVKEYSLFRKSPSLYEFRLFGASKDPATLIGYTQSVIDLMLAFYTRWAAAAR